MSSIVKVESNPDGRLLQGDIYQKIDILQNFSIKNDDFEIRVITFPYIIVLSQDCDLSEDYRTRIVKSDNKDKQIFSILVAPLYNAAHVFSGEHLDSILQNMRVISSGGKTEITKIKNNENPRYHYLEFPEQTGLAPMVIDFKHFFTLDMEKLSNNRNTNYKYTLSPLFREKVTQRFSFFLSRIGLPVITNDGKESPECYIEQ